MKQLMLAAVASIALSLPVMAQSNNGNTTPTDQTGTQQQYNNQSQSQDQNGTQQQAQGQQDQNANQQQAQNQIDPSQLDREQIRHIQAALDQKGFNVKHVDGKWGPQTEAALKQFQQKQNLQGNGQLDQETLGALGVNMNEPTRQGSATTGSGSNESRQGRPAQNPGATNDETTGQSSPSMHQNSGGSGYDQNGKSKPSVNDWH